MTTPTSLTSPPEAPMTPPTASSSTEPDPYAQADQRIQLAPLPLPKTLRRRSSLPVQIWRFTLINLKIVKMVTKGHH